MKEKQVDKIIQASLVDFKPRALEMTAEWCSDCPKSSSCLSCKTFTTMVKVHLAAIVEEQAILN